MARDKVVPFVHMINNACATGDSMAVIEGMRVFGYVNEIEYSKLCTAWAQMTQGVLVRSDGAETIELARTPKRNEPGYVETTQDKIDAEMMGTPKDPEEILPREF
jgi:hypothetical protein